MSIFTRIINWFRPGYRVRIDDYAIRIIESMMADEKYSYSYTLWDYLEAKFGIRQYYNWDESKNYMVFDSEEDFLIFLLKL